MRYVRQKMKVKESIGPLTTGEGDGVAAEPKEMAKILNKFFGTVFTMEDTTHLPVPRELCREDQVMASFEIELSEVEKKLKGLKPEKAPGDDGINPVILKEVPQLALPLQLIFNASLRDGVVPLDWKKANVTPIFKQGSKAQPGNYRPVSLTSQVCKVMERILRDHVLAHLQEHQLIRQTQHGFMKGRSCLTNLLTFLEKVTNYVDQGLPVDVLYLDFSKAFDKVPHTRLLSKLQACGLGRILCGWIKSWLSQREQRVVVKGCASEWLPVGSGVPQGSVLGPILFTIYINDIDENACAQMLKFADNTKVFGPVATEQQIQTLQAELTRMFDWSVDWQMIFNIGKCKCLHIGYNNPNHTYQMNGEDVAACNQEKDLGVIISETLTQHNQVAKVVKKANQIVGTIKRVYCDRSKDNIIPLYKSLIRPHLEYCVQAWRPFHQQDIDNIEGVQRRITKMIVGCESLTYPERLRRLNLISLEMRRLRADLIEVFKIMHGLEGLERDDFFILRESTNLRGHRFTIHKQHCRLNCRKFFFTQRVITEWNNLPSSTVTSTSVNMFKNAIKTKIEQMGEQFISQHWLHAPVLLSRSDA